MFYIDYITLFHDFLLLAILDLVPLRVIGQIVSVSAVDAMTAEIQLSSDQIAPFVWLTAPGIEGRFSDNGFLMVNKTMTVRFMAWEALNPKRFAQSLAVRSLMDVYT